MILPDSSVPWLPSLSRQTQRQSKSAPQGEDGNDLREDFISGSLSTVSLDHLRRESPSPTPRRFLNPKGLGCGGDISRAQQKVSSPS